MLMRRCFSIVGVRQAAKFHDADADKSRWRRGDASSNSQDDVGESETDLEDDEVGAACGRRLSGQDRRGMNRLSS